MGIKMHMLIIPILLPQKMFLNHHSPIAVLAAIVAFSPLIQSAPTRNGLNTITVPTSTGDVFNFLLAGAPATGQIKRSSEDVVKLPGMDGKPAHVDKISEAYVKKWFLNPNGAPLKTGSGTYIPCFKT
jgi:hypothetical protein